MTVGPDVQVGPLGGLAFWAIVVLLVLGFIGGITTGGILFFVIFGALLVLAAFFLVQRVLRRLGGS